MYKNNNKKKPQCISVNRTHMYLHNLSTYLIFYIAYDRDRITNQQRKNEVSEDSSQKTRLLYAKNKVESLCYMSYHLYDEF